MKQGIFSYFDVPVFNYSWGGLGKEARWDVPDWMRDKDWAMAIFCLPGMFEGSILPTQVWIYRNQVDTEYI